MNSTLALGPVGDLEIAVVRKFNAPRELVFEALTKPEFVKRWLLGPDGWTMPVCEIDARPGGHYRYEWEHPSGQTMGAGGTFIEVVPPDKFVCTEKFDPGWYPGEAILTYKFEESNELTTLTLTIRYESNEARDLVLRSPMEAGLAQSYDRLSDFLESISTK